MTATTSGEEPVEFVAVLVVLIALAGLMQVRRRQRR